MFSRISQIGKNLTDELAKNIDENGSPRRSNNGNSDETPKNLEGVDEDLNSTPDGDDDVNGKSSTAQAALSPEIKAKLKKFAKYEAKYPQLLEAYRTEKAKAEQITNFEKILQENTPCSSISEGDALAEYLNSLTLKNTMLNDELRRVTKGNSDEESTKVKELLKQIDQLKKDLEMKPEESDEALDPSTEKELTETSKESYQLAKQVEEQKLKNESLAKEILEVKKEKAALEEKLSSQDKEQLDVESIRKEYDSKISTLENDLKSANESLSVKKKDIEAAQGESSALKTDKLELQEECTKLSKDLQISKESNAALEKEVQDLKQKDTENIKIIGNLEEQIQEFKLTIESKKKEFETLKQDKPLVEEKPLEVHEKEINDTPSTSSSKKSKKKKKKNNNINKNNEDPLTPESSIKDSQQIPASEINGSDESSPLQVKYDKLVLDFEGLKANAAKDSKDSKKMTALEDKIKSLEKELQLAVEDNSKLRAKVKTHSDEVENTRDMLKNVGDDLVTSRDELKSVKAKYDELSSTLKKSTEAANAETSQVAEQLKTIEAQKVELEVLRKQHAQVVTDYEKEKAENRKLVTTTEDEKRKLEDKVSELGEQCRNLEKKIKALESEHSEKIKSFTSELNSVKNAKDKLETRQKDFNTEKTELTIKISKLQDELKILAKIQKSEASLKKELATAQTNLGQRDRTIGYFEKQVKEYDINKTQLLDEIAKLKNANKDLGSKIVTSNEQRTKLIQDRSKLNDSLRDLKTQLEESVKENKSLIDKVDVLQDKYDGLQEAKSSSNDQIETIKKQCEELSINSKEARQRVEQLEEELSESRAMLQERTREASTIRRLLLEGEQNQSSKIQELNSEVTQLTDENDRLRSENSIALSRQQRQLEDAQIKNQELERVLSGWEAKEESYTREIKELQSFKEKLELERRTSYSSSDELSGVISKLKDSLSVSEKKVREYENLNNVLKRLNEELNMKIDRITKNYKLASTQLNSLKEKSRQSSSIVASPNGSPISTRSNSVVSNLNSSSVVDVGFASNAQGMGTNGGAEASGLSEEKTAYVKNVLLGFLEHKEQRQQLLPVISMLLQLNKTDEKRLLVALK